MRQHITTIALGLLFASARGQTLTTLPSDVSPLAQVSILTIYPTPQAVYNLFGHTLVRVQDRQQALDVTFNYGVFRFTEGFYVEYLKGNLQYYTEVTTYEQAYQQHALREDRTIHEQVLQLSHQEQRTLYRLLCRDVALNSPYLYNYFTNNCSSKVRDVIAEGVGSALLFSARCGTTATRYSYRRLFLGKFDPHYPWTKWMVALTIGLAADKPIRHRERMFLPEYLEEGIACAVVQRKDGPVPLALPSKVLYERRRDKQHPNRWQTMSSPFACSVLLLCLTILITYRRTINKVYGLWVDVLLFSVAGFLGILLLFLWLFTQHSSANNYHLIWSLPTHALAIYGLHTRHRRWALRYWQVMLSGLVVLAGMAVLYWPLTQHVVLFVPLMLSLLVRIVHHIRLPKRLLHKHDSTHKTFL